VSSIPIIHSLSDEYHPTHFSHLLDLTALAPPPPPPESKSGPPISTAADADLHIPWTLRNKYYSADLHFALSKPTGWRVEDVAGAPALIYVWSDGTVKKNTPFDLPSADSPDTRFPQPYRRELARLASDLSRAKIDPEITLAVRVPPASDAPSAQEEDDADDADDDDTFAASHGFEYVDGRPDRVPDDTGIHPHAYSLSLFQSPTQLNPTTDIPTLPRVLDALGTVMWPSMQRAPGRSAARSSRLPTADLLALDEDDEQHALAALLRNSSGDEDALVKGLQELERWLESDEDHDDEHDEHDRWTMTGEEEEPRTPLASAPKSGFDDDFAAFVSAPPPSARPTGPRTGSAPQIARVATEDWPSGSNVPSISLSPAAGTGTSSHDAPFTHAFGSTFDFDAAGRSPVPTHPHGASIDDEDEGLHADTDGAWTALGSASDLGSTLVTGAPPHHDPDLPTPAEVAETSARIFGADNDDNDGAPGGPGFDLSRVLGALEGMKAEIARMPDDEARRRAAARVALGLAQGLGIDG
jgi:hypothetical protein